MANISITVDEIDAIISKLNSASSEIEKLWDSIKSEELEQLKKLWIGKDCNAYIDKIIDVDVDVQNALKAQNLLADTFKKTKQQVQDTQDSLAEKIRSV